MVKAPRPCPFAVVADDDATIRMYAAEILEEAGYETIQAKHGDDAIAVLEQHNAGVHLLFTDVQMPDGSRDGFELAREVASRWPHIAIVIVSGATHPRAGDLPDGATFIAKPFSADVVHGHLQMITPGGRKPEPR